MKVQREDKPWGYELLLARTEQYAGKILCIHAGQRLSLQHHVAKDETLFLLDGDTELELLPGDGPPSRQRMTADQSYRVPPGLKHRLAALSDARVLEVSSPQLEDVVRWEDDYGRLPPEPGSRVSARASRWSGDAGVRRSPRASDKE